jgi:hypothetical protein
MTFVRNGINDTIKTFRPCRERFEHPKQPFVGDSRQYLGQNWPLCGRFGSSKFQIVTLLSVVSRHQIEFHRQDAKSAKNWYKILAFLASLR